MPKKIHKKKYQKEKLFKKIKITILIKIKM